MISGSPHSPSPPPSHFRLLKHILTHKISTKHPNQVAINNPTVATVINQKSSTIRASGPRRDAARDELVALGKNHAVSIGLIVSAPLFPVIDAVALAGTSEDSVRIPHCTSLPEYVCVRDTSVGPVTFWTV